MLTEAAWLVEASVSLSLQGGRVCVSSQKHVTQYSCCGTNTQHKCLESLKSRTWTKQVLQHAQRILFSGISLRLILKQAKHFLLESLCPQWAKYAAALEAKQLIPHVTRGKKKRFVWINWKATSGLGLGSAGTESGIRNRDILKSDISHI